MKKINKLILLGLFIAMNNSNINAKGNPVIQAAKSGSPKLNNLKENYKKNATSQEISNALSSVAPFHNFFNINDQEEKTGNTVLHYIATYNFVDFVDCLWLLKDFKDLDFKLKNFNDLDLKLKNDNGNTPRKKYNGDTPLEVTIKEKKYKNTALLTCLGAKFTEVEYTNQNDDEIDEEISVFFTEDIADDSELDKTKKIVTFTFDDFNKKIKPYVDEFNNFKEKDDSKLNETELKIKKLLNSQINKIK